MKKLIIAGTLMFAFAGLGYAQNDPATSTKTSSHTQVKKTTKKSTNKPATDSKSESSTQVQEKKSTTTEGTTATGGTTKTTTTTHKHKTHTQKKAAPSQ